MKDVFLFPQKLKVVGWIVLIPSLILGLVTMFNSGFELSILDWKGPWYYGVTEHDNFTNELLMILVLISALLVGFSKTKEEDEYVRKIRLDSLVWSMYVNYGIVFIGIIGVYGFAYVNLLVFNLFTPLIIFIIRFQYYYSKR